MPPKTFYVRIGKRLVDVTAALLGLILLAPLFLVCAALIVLDSKGPVFFRHARVGRRGRPFLVLKFRTMFEGGEHVGGPITVAGDHRVTWAGRLLRRLKIDEFPQLWNVLKGEMSLVGPRPEVAEYVETYTSEQLCLLLARPGITDPASIAFRNEEQILAASPDHEAAYREHLLPRKLDLSLEYIRRITLRRDLGLILATLKALMAHARRGGGHVAGAAGTPCSRQPGAPGAVHTAGVGVNERRTKAGGYEFYSTLNQRIIDASISGLSLWLAYQVRFDWHVRAADAYQMWLLLPFIMLGLVASSSLLGTYRLIWRYISLKDALIVTRGHVVLSALLIIVRLEAPARWQVLRAPLSVIVLEFFFSLSGSLGARVLRRLLHEGLSAALRRGTRGKRVVLVGAGDAGLRVAKELAGRGDIRPVGFVDDDPKKLGTVINGVGVLGSIAGLPSIVRKRKAVEVIICIAQPANSMLKRIWALCENLPVRVKIVPTLREILEGRFNIAAFRDVQVSDLLGRETVGFTPRRAEMELPYRGKRILITGAGGSIGSELARQLLGFGLEELVVLDKDENGLFELCSRLRPEAGRPPIRPVVADLRFYTRLESIMTRFHPDVVFHAAAHKHVPLMEMNPSEAVLNNVTGTRNLVELACAHGVTRFVLISTDKAVRPTSVMGATKRLCEMIVQAVAGRLGDFPPPTPPAGRANGPPHFACVRFGNVVGSRGSVIPLFQEQIARGGPVTVTHPEMERFLMTIPEAVSLVIQAGSLGSAGEIFILDMGDPVHIMKLAHELIELSGLQPGRDIEVEITELRPGEKLREELIDPRTEKLSPTKFEKISVIEGRPSVDIGAFSRKIAALEDAAQRESDQEILQILEELGISLQPRPAGQTP